MLVYLGQAMFVNKALSGQNFLWHQTSGSGKTTALAVILLNAVDVGNAASTQALVVTHTKEIASQVLPHCCRTTSEVYKCQAIFLLKLIHFFADHQAARNLWVLHARPASGPLPEGVHLQERPQLREARRGASPCSTGHCRRPSGG